MIFWDRIKVAQSDLIRHHQVAWNIIGSQSDSRVILLHLICWLRIWVNFGARRTRRAMCLLDKHWIVSIVAMREGKNDHFRESLSFLMGVIMECKQIRRTDHSGEWLHELGWMATKCIEQDEDRSKLCLDTIISSPIRRLEKSDRKFHWGITFASRSTRERRVRGTHQ